MQVVIPVEDPTPVPSPSPVAGSAPTPTNLNFMEQTPSQLRWRGATPDSPNVKRVRASSVPPRSQRDEAAVRGASIAAVGSLMLLASFILLIITDPGTTGKGDGTRRHHIHLAAGHQQQLNAWADSFRLEDGIRADQVRCSAATRTLLFNSSVESASWRW